MVGVCTHLCNCVCHYQPGLDENTFHGGELCCDRCPICGNRVKREAGVSQADFHMQDCHTDEQRVAYAWKLVENQRPL